MRKMYSEKQLLKAVESESQKNGIKVFENIVDKDGHPRFIEIEGIPLEAEGFTCKYCKATLSGTHLALVLAGKFNNGFELANTRLCTFKLPSWIYAKIIPIWSNLLSANIISVYNDDWSTQQVQIKVQVLNGYIYFESNAITMNKDRNFRYQFDLIIDNE